MTRDELDAATTPRYKYAMHSGPHPSLTVDCPECGSPAGHYCNGYSGEPIDGVHSTRRLMAEGAALNERVASVHERQNCPTCWAPKGVRCKPMPKGYVVGRTGRVAGRDLKHPHDARVRADGIALR